MARNTGKSETNRSYVNGLGMPVGSEAPKGCGRRLIATLSLRQLREEKNTLHR